MKNKTFFLIIAILFVFAVQAYALGSRDPAVQTVQITGRVRLVGSSPMTELVITNQDREWYIDEKDQKKLWLLQQQIVTVKGKEYFSDMTFANGVPAGRKYFLKDIKIIDTH